MARHESIETPLTTADLKRLHREITLLAPTTVEARYRELWERCKFQSGSVPSPRTIQTLVAHWKVLYGWRKMRR